MAMVLDQVFDAAEFRRNDFFIGGQRENEVAIQAHILLLQLNHDGDQCRRHCLVVGRAARVKVTVFLDQLEGIALPFFAFGVDGVDVGEQQQRFLRARAAQTRNEVAFFRPARRHDDLKVGGRKAARAQMRCHRLGRTRGIAAGVAGVDPDEFLVNLAQQLLFGRLRCGRAGANQHDGRGEGSDELCDHA